MLDNGWGVPPARIRTCAVRIRLLPQVVTISRWVGPRVTDADRGPVGSDQAGDGRPVRAVLLGPATKGTQKQPFALVCEPQQPREASGHGVVVEPAVDDPAQPLGRFVPMVVPPPAKRLLDPPQSAVAATRSGTGVGHREQRLDFVVLEVGYGAVGAALVRDGLHPLGEGGPSGLVQCDDAEERPDGGEAGAQVVAAFGPEMTEELAEDHRRRHLQLTLCVAHQELGHVFPLS